MLKEAAINWVRSNCTDPKLRSDFARQLRDVLQRRVDCFFAVGQALTRRHVPYVIHCFAGELFIFELNPAQAAGLMLAPNALGCFSDPRPAAPSGRAVPLLMSLSNFELDNPVLTSDAPVTGSFDYEIVGQPPESYCLRLDCSAALSEDETSWHTPEHALCGSGRVRFSFNPLKKSIWPFAPLRRGPLAVFLRACTLPLSEDASLRRPISNTCGALIDIG